MAQLYYTVKDISNKLSVSPYTVRKWIREGKLRSLPHLDNQRDSYRITLKAFNDFIRENRRYVTEARKDNESYIFQRIIKTLFAIESDHLKKNENNSDEYEKGWAAAIDEMHNKITELYIGRGVNV